MFSRRGVQENTVTVAEALRAKKPVVHLDVSDAFNTVKHHLIQTALQQSGCPRWILDIVQSVYTDCIMVPVHLLENPLAGLSRALSAEQLQLLSHCVFLSKFGIANCTENLTINDTPVPYVTNERAYKYLGTETFTSNVGGLDACLQKIWEPAENIEVSEFTAKQKLLSVRTKVLPMMYHLVENPYTTQEKLHKFIINLRKLTRQLCYPPERATNAYIHLNQMYGGHGTPNFV